jgi:diguanylate cyclase (GGDEF)-like protein
MKRKILPIFLSVIVAVFCFTFFANTMRKTQEMSDMKELNIITDRISSRLSNAFAYADILELSVQFDDGKFLEQKFVELSDTAMKQNTCIDSFQLAPNAVVSYINPMEGNEAIIGYDLLNDPASRNSVIQAQASDSVVSQGPIDAIQGKTMIFGRKAIRVNGEFWGLAIISIDFEKFLEECGMTSDDLPFEYAITVYDNNDNQTYVWGDEKISQHSSVYTDITLPEQIWRISLIHKNSTSGWTYLYLIYLIASILIGGFIYLIVVDYYEKANLSKTDPLTKTLNRAEFQRQVEKRLKRNQKCALLAIDMDKFKFINDTYGHLAGDKVLVTTAERIKKSIRSIDLVSRVGGDEYMILLSHIKNRDELISIIKKIQKTAGDEISIEDAAVNVGLSIGYALSPDEGQEYEALYHIADMRMYEEKTSNDTER